LKIITAKTLSSIFLASFLFLILLPLFSIFSPAIQLSSFATRN